MSTPHIVQYWTAGDDWRIYATLIDETGAPFDLSGSPDIKYALVNDAGVLVLDQADVLIAVVDPAAGTCTIDIPAALSSPLAGGDYRDAIRLVIGGVTSTLSYGAVRITADPWAPPAAAGLRAVS
jgi:hypothetical protein